MRIRADPDPKHCGELEPESWIRWARAGELEQESWRVKELEIEIDKWSFINFFNWNQRWRRLFRHLSCVRGQDGEGSPASSLSLQPALQVGSSVWWNSGPTRAEFGIYMRIKVRPKNFYLLTFSWSKRGSLLFKICLLLIPTSGDIPTAYILVDLARNIWQLLENKPLQRSLC